MSLPEVTRIMNNDVNELAYMFTYVMVIGPSIHGDKERWLCFDKTPKNSTHMRVDSSFLYGNPTYAQHYATSQKGHPTSMLHTHTSIALFHPTHALPLHSSILRAHFHCTLSLYNRVSIASAVGSVVNVQFAQFVPR